MRLVLLAVAVVGLGGCFDPQSPVSAGTDGADTSTTSVDPGCPDGSAACPCYGNGTCDAGLECNATVQLCIPMDCDPGSESCTCNDGSCLAGLQCEGGVCVTPSATATTDPATTDPATTDVTTDPVTTDPATTDVTDSATSESDPATTDPVTTDPATTDTDPTGECAGDDCVQCLMCAISDDGPCAGQYAACSAEQGCIDLLTCCNDNPANCPGCCIDSDPLVVLPLFMDYTACINDDAPCPGCAVQSC